MFGSIRSATTAAAGLLTRSSTTPNG